MASTTNPTVSLPRLARQETVLRLAVEVLDGPDAGRSVEAEDERVRIGTAQGNDLVVGDPSVSGFHLELVARERGIEVVDLSSTNGTRHGHAWIERAILEPGAVLEIGHTRLRIRDAAPASVDLYPGERLGQLRGRTPIMRRLMAQVARAAPSDSSVLIMGESGTGKELIARALHEGSARAAAPFVTVDCAALTPNLVASELFGHERGAFTGADRQHLGAFERANGGSLLLDEVGELPGELQSTLLGVLERRSFRRVGGTADIAVDLRVISATHRDLRAEVNVGTFRLDLFYRLAVLQLEAPPLRNRPDDVPLLARHFLRECGFDGPIEALFGPTELARLSSHRFPGNVRELRNLMEAAVVMGELPSTVGLEASATPPDALGDLPIAFDLPYKDARATLVRAFERSYLSRLLEDTSGNVSEAARRAKMTRSHLFELLRRHGLR